MTRPPDRQGLLSVEATAQYLGLSAGTLPNWVSLRRIEYVKVGRLTRFSAATLDRYITAHTVEAAGE